MIKNNLSELNIELINSDESFVALKDAWDQLIEKSFNSSVYASFPFVYTSWKHHRSENDELFILVVKRRTTIIGIAPFRIERVKIASIPVIRNIQIRIIRFIAEWGDKPTILTTEEPEIIWDNIFRYLNNKYTQWDVISLAEQPITSPVLSQKILSSFRYSAQTYLDSTSYYISIDGKKWEDYVNSRGKNTRRALRINRDKLSRLPEGITFQCVEDPERIPEALMRFIRVEQSGWKKNRDFAVGSNKKTTRYYEELLIQLAHQNQVAIFFLTSGTTDIAAEILYRNHNIAYLSSITYREEYSQYSPGVILRAEIIKSLFDAHYRECDLLGFQGEDKNTLKKNWSTGSLQTIRIQVYKKSITTCFSMNEDLLKQIPKKFQAIIIATMVYFSELLKSALAYIT
jgi:hypothetical protein